MTQGMINKLVTVLETTLSKLSRYDEGSFIGSILSLTVFFFFLFHAYLPTFDQMIEPLTKFFFRRYREVGKKWDRPT